MPSWSEAARTSPAAELRTPLRAVLGAEIVDPAVVDAVDRRGRSVRCRVTFAPLDGNGEPRGAIAMMEVITGGDADHA